MLTEQAVHSPGVGKVRLAGRVLLARSCSTSLSKMCTETEHVTRQPLAPTLQPDTAMLTEQDVPSPGSGKVGLAGRVEFPGFAGKMH